MVGWDHFDNCITVAFAWVGSVSVENRHKQPLASWSPMIITTLTTETIRKPATCESRRTTGGTWIKPSSFLKRPPRFQQRYPDRGKTPPTIVLEFIYDKNPLSSRILRCLSELFLLLLAACVSAQFSLLRPGRCIVGKS